MKIKYLKFNINHRAHREHGDYILSLRGILRSLLSKQSRLELLGNCNSNILFEKDAQLMIMIRKI